MANKTSDQDAAQLAATRREFEQWRSTRRRGARIPDHLWSAAVRVARQYGVTRATQDLRLDFYALKERMKASSSPRDETSRPMEFVEVAPLAPTPECILEIHGEHGRTVRLTLQGLTATALAAVARSLTE
ncbi:MAG: hypothetical protein GY725_00245 [bacterium]|nr:hypothetical protein [bacterium]